MGKSKAQQKQQVIPLKQHKRFWVTIILWVVFLFAFGSGLKVLAKQFEEVVLPNVYIGEFNIGGKTKEEVEKFLFARFSELEKQGPLFSYRDTRVRIQPLVTALSDLDLTYTLYSVDSKKTAEEVIEFGKHGSIMDRAMLILVQIFRPKHFRAAILVEREKMREVLEQNFSSHEQPVKKPKVSVGEVKGEEKPTIEITDLDRQAGIRLNYDRAMQNFQSNLSVLNQGVVEIQTIVELPAVTEGELFDPANEIFERLNLILANSETVFERATTTQIDTEQNVAINRGELASFLEFQRNPQVCQGCPRILIVPNKSFDLFLERVAQEVEVKVLDAKFVVKNGKVDEFQGARDGLILDRKAFREAFERASNESQAFPSQFILPMIEVKPTILTHQVNDFGIKEIIGVGRSNFKGSPPNRRHNIAVGAAAVNGTLVAPGEEFSLNKTLGEVSGATGYLPELVIKGDKTIPEYGGGLCQIGTTTFRAALASGLPITARTNHSYRVQYYEPAGTDATIYAPSPDFRFLNDTGNYLLIQTRIQGDDLIFEFWGTKDGRGVEQTKPRIFNIVAPPEKKYIETLDLKPGEEKCTERAHAGADAEFTYRVTYTDGTVKQQVFKSHYRPWQAVCLKGVKELSKPNGEVISSE